MTKNAKPELTMVDARIEPIQSQYSDSIASIRATLVFECEGRATGREERRALAIGHRIAADLVDALDEIAAAHGYTAPTTEVGGSYRNRIEASVTYELTTGTPAEVDAVIALLHDIIPAPTA